MMDDDARESAARGLIDRFLRETGVTSDAPARRYLWTDAFAVCTCLSLHQRDPGSRALDDARMLVDQVHDVLGRHRPDDRRVGWLSGMDEETGELHPTAGGLRIGKPLPERGPDERFDRQLEWQRDGQYFHYLTRWMHALARVAEAAGEPRYLGWAIELAHAAHEGFVTHDEGGRPLAIHWKMSVDLARSLVPGMGAHDPLDGLITCADLRFAARAGLDVGGSDVLEREMEELAVLCRKRAGATDDPLGAGGFLVLLWRAASLAAQGAPVEGLALDWLAGTAIASLEATVRSPTLALPPESRLPFRELGLSIGAHALRATAELGERAGARAGELALQAHERWGTLAGEIERYWLEPSRQEASTWREHEDINAVMLAASLLPSGYLGTPSAAPGSAP